MSNNSARKAAALIGLSIVIGGAWDANAATTCTVDREMLANPVADAATLIGFVRSDGCDIDLKSAVTARFSPAALQDDSTSDGLSSSTTDGLSSAQFNPVLGVLAHSMAFSLNSAISSALPGGGEGASKSESLGPLDLSNVAGLQGGPTSTDFTDSGKAGGDPDLTSLSVAWTGSTTGQGPTLDPAATPLPASLVLFLTGIGGLGLLGWHTKRKSRVSLLGAA